MMTDKLSSRFRQILLQTHRMLFPYEMECRFFYEEMLPTDCRMSVLEIFQVLVQKQVISPYDVKSLKQFVVAVDRNDVEELLKVYETRVFVQMLIEGYLDFRSGMKTIPAHKTDFIARYLANNRYDDITKMGAKVHKIAEDGFPLAAVITDLLRKRFPVLNDWKTVLAILQICCEIVYVRFSFTRNFKQLMSDLDEIMENVLIREVPWMAKHDGLFGYECCSVL